MAKLSDFATLAEARAHTETILKPLSERMLNERGVFALIGMVAGETLMQTIEADAQISARIKNWFVPSEQGVDIVDPSVQGLLEMMVLANSQTPGVGISQADSDKLTAHAYTVNKPFEKATAEEFAFNQPEELALPSNTAQHIINFNITNSAPNLVNVTVLHRFGSASDLTPWHSCGGTRVQYKQASYKVMVPAVEADIRELKLVTDYQLGLSIG